MQGFHGVNVNEMMHIKGTHGYGVSIAVAQGEQVETYCTGSGRFAKNFPVQPDMIFQAGSVSKTMFALTLLRCVDKGIIDLDADISGVVADIVDRPVTFSALLSHTAGFNVHGFAGYRARHRLLTLENVLLGKGNSPKVKKVLPAGEQFSYSGGGITLAELAFTRITGMTLRDAFAQEIAAPLELTQSGFFQPLNADRVANAAFGGMLGIFEDHKHGYHYYPETAAAGFWSTPTELVKIGIALSRSVREGGLLRKETAERMVTPVKDRVGLCIFRGAEMPQLAGHDGWNCGFLTTWKFSLTEDLCVAAMINKSTVSVNKRLCDMGKTLFVNARDEML